MTDIARLREQRAQNFARMSEIMDKARAQNRALTPSEAKEFDQLDSTVSQADDYLKRRSVEMRSADYLIDTHGSFLRAGESRTVEDIAFTRYLRSGEIRASSGLSTSPDNGQTGSDSAGYMIPQGFWVNLQIALKQYGGIERDFRLVQTDTGNPMPWPTVDPTAVTGGVISTELSAASTISPYVFGQGVLQAWTIALNGPILASVQLVQDAAFDVDSFVSDRIGEGIGRTLAQLAISGTGSGQHLGIITALNGRGVWSAGSSGGYISLTAGTTVNTFGGSVTELAGNLLSPQTLLKMIGAVDPAYRDGAKFYVNDAHLEGMRSTVDLYGRPLLVEPSAGSGAPTLWGYPVVVDQNIPSLTASTTGGPVFGNMRFAMVYRQARDVQVMRLVERYADALAVGYYGYARSDFRSNDLRAAVTVKPAAT